MKPANIFFPIVRKAKFVILLYSLLLVSCGGSVITAGIGGTGITFGEVTGFGSIFVNGVEFDTSNSEFVVNGNIFATQAGLAVGMVVKINGSTDANGITGTANSVVYDSEIEGPVEAAPVPVPGSGGNQMSFTIFGQQIIIDQAATSFMGTSYDTLLMDDLVEVSGFHAPDGSIRATFVERKGVLAVSPDVSLVELKGTISEFTDLFSPFFVNNISIDMNGNPTIDPPDSNLANGDFVEVEGTYYQGASSIYATEIEVEDNDFGESVDQISLQGIVTGFTESQGLRMFFIDGQLVDATGATVSPAGAMIVNGINVEVDGSIIGGTLFADEVELR